jgi:hypothetical protein
MPSTPRGRDAATILAVVLAIALALLWLRSSDDSAPAVPAGLSVATVPAAVPEEPATRTGLGQGGEGSGAGDPDAEERPGGAADGKGAVPMRRGERARPSKRRGAKHGHADRAGGGEDARPPAGGGWARTRSRQDPPATALAPSAGSGTAGGGAGAGTGGGGAVTAPEFALE